MTYLDMADTTYSRGENIEECRKWGRVEIYDSNTVGKYYLCLLVSASKGNVSGREESAHIRLNRGQVKQIIKALQKFLEYAEGGAK